MPRHPGRVGTILTSLLIILGLIVLNGIFAGAEIAVVSVRRARVKELADEGNARARAVLVLRNNPDRFFATVQIGITVVSATAAALGGSKLAAQVAPTFERWGLGTASTGLAFAVVVGGISFLSLVLGELVPKSLGIRFADRYALSVSRALVGLGRLTRPVVWFLTFCSNLFLRFFGDKTTFSEGRMSAEELQQLVEDAAKSGSVDIQTGEIASRAFDLKDVSVGAVMVPRHKMVALQRTAAFDDVRRLVLETGHTRIPVRDGAMDEICGYIVAKDLLSFGPDGGVDPHGPGIVDKILRPAYFMPETMNALDALRELQRRRLQLAVVVDERGTVAGLVTVEDLVEELVGEIVSEHEVPVQLVHKQQDGRITVSGGSALRDVNREAGLDLPEADGYTTVAGLVIAIAGRIPTQGETFKSEDGSEIEVLEATPRRIKRVAIRPPERPPPREDEESADRVTGSDGEAAHVVH